MAFHRFKSMYGQCTCLWCGKRYGGDCPVTKEMRDALKDFAAKNGRSWKTKLAILWERGEAGPVLQNVRNIIGVKQLYRFTKVMMTVRPTEPVAPLERTDSNG